MEWILFLFIFFGQDLQDLEDLFSPAASHACVHLIILAILSILSEIFYRFRLHSSFTAAHGIFV